MDCRAVCENNIFGGYRSPNVNTNPREWTFKYRLQKKDKKECLEFHICSAHMRLMERKARYDNEIDWICCRLTCVN